jgi:serine protease SohB
MLNMAKKHPRPLLRWIPLKRFRERTPIVPIVRIEGTIMPGSGSVLRQSPVNLEALEPVLERAFAVRGACAVALVINSPGGSPVQSSLIGRRIRDLAKEHELPVIAFVEDVAASGGYWIASAADEIIADACSIVGSIGVISGGFGFQGAIDKLGVERRLYTKGSHKGMLDAFLPVNPEHLVHLNGVMEGLYQAFVAYIRARRADKLNGDDATLFSGAFWTAEQALSLGLVDSLGELRSTLRARFGDKVVLQPVDRRRGLLSRLGIGSSAAQGQLAEGLVGAALQALENRLNWSRYGL